MTLKYLINHIIQVAINEQLINYAQAGSSLSEINPEEVKYYPVLFVSPTGNHRVTENTTLYSITLYFLDRLQQDNSNVVDVYSAAIEELKNLVIQIREKVEGVIGVNPVFDIRNFNMTEKMDDRCAGAYATIEILTDNEFVCPVD